MDCLEDLYLDNNTVVDLKDLVIIRRLKKLSLSNVKVENPEQFIYMNEIESLRIDGSGVKDITPLLSMDKLKMLVIDKEQAIYNKKYINEFKDVSGAHVAFEIPGDPKLTPNTVIENATQKIANLERAKEEREISDIAAHLNLPEVVVTAPRINKPPLKVLYHYRI